MTGAPPRLIKVSATGELLSRTADDWSGVFIPAIELLVARRITPKKLSFNPANAACREIDLCGAVAERSISMREFINHAAEDARFNPVLDPEFFTIDDPLQWIWTCDECAPASYSFVVYLHLGSVDRSHRGAQYRALAVRSGQFLSLQLSEFLARGVA